MTGVMRYISSTLICSASTTQLNASFRKARSEHQDELDRQAKKLEREYKVKLAKRDALVAQQQQDLQRRFHALQRADNSPMVPTGNSMSGTGQRNANPPS